MPSTYLDRFTGSVLADMGKAPCDAATTANITLAGYQTIDGVALNTDYLRVLVKNQKDQTKNGIWVVFSGNWQRSADFSGPTGTVFGQFVEVTGGTQAGLWQVTTPNPILIDGNAPSNITFDVFLLNTSARAVAPELQVGAAGADSVMLVGFDEFIYNPTAIFGADGSPFNCSYDKLINGLPNNQCKGNINYTLAQDLSPCPSVQTAVMWAQWWTVAAGASADMSGLQPGINNILYGNLGTNTWSVNSVSASSALKLPGKIGGTSDDAAFLAGAQLLAARGYKVGIAPVAIGINLDSGTPNSGQTTWRGYFSWPDSSTFNTWCTKYQAFVKHYFDMLNNAGIPVDIVYIGSEMQNLTLNASTATTIWGIWVAALKSLADYIKGKSPGTKVTYAANWAEYGNGGNFALDALWSYANIDYVGIDWYPPITVTTDDSFGNYTAGLRAGEQMDWTVDQSSAAQRSLLTTSHNGKVGLAQTPIKPPQSQKNLHGFYFNCHYLSIQGTTYAESTPLPGYDRAYNPNGLGLMQNVPAFGRSAALPAASGNYGMYPPPGANDTWAQFSGTASNTSLTLPAWSNTQYFQWINFTFKITTGSPTNNGRLFRTVDGSGNVLECLIDTSGGGHVKLNVNGTYINLCAIDQNIHTVAVKIDVQGGTTYTTVDGGGQVTTTTASPLTMVSGGTMYIASYDGTNNPLPVNFYDLQIYLSVGSSSTTALTHGGEFHFDEPYCGVRTNWLPQSKPICICETGFASIGGSGCEPNVFPTADYGSALALPDWLDSFTSKKYASWLALGWNPSNLYGPYGSNFAYDQVGQAAALLATVGWLKSLPWVARVCVYAIDARPSATMLAVYQGALYYIDGPLYKLSQTLNGKLAGGVFSVSDLP